ncbi:MAG: peptide chain release factor N(5)-glutamine methyltransferase [Deltaproteobacteria bacterium]|jgi:release factor glutamine methyltransferase|nr:peptide chain release factor N(5)-glutamine methyltransferase [Deltaproteobacteria bacterium]
MPRENRTWTIGEILDVTTGFFAERGMKHSPRLEAELLLAKVINLSRVNLYVNFERVLAEDEITAYRALVARRGKFEPVAYILGEKEFHGIPFKVDSRVLVPRPETELIADEVLRLARKTGDPKPSILDIGTGSGAIAVTLAKKLPESFVTASDLSPDALAAARENAEANGLANIAFILADLTDPPFPEDGEFDFVLANLPYVSSAEMAKLPPDVKNHEPAMALDGGPDGLDLYRRLVPKTKKLLKPGGRALFELDPGQFPAMTELATENGLTPLEPLKDLARFDRIFAASREGD